jgi:hypothetical protein
MTDYPGNDETTETGDAISSDKNGDRATADLHEEKALQIVEQLLAQDIAVLPEDDPLLYHQPSGYAFESSVNLAHFHKGWEAARKQSDDLNA